MANTITNMIKADPCRKCPPMACSYDMRRRFSLTNELHVGGCAHYYLQTALPNLPSYVKSLNLPKGDLLVPPVRGWEAFLGTAFDHRLQGKYEPIKDDGVTRIGLQYLDTEAGKIVQNGLNSKDINEQAIYAAVADWERRRPDIHAGMRMLHNLAEAGESLKQQLIADIQQMLSLATERLQLTKPTFRPIFSGSVWIGGADGDLIDNRRLIDIKCTTKVQFTPFVRQVVAYALLDIHNDYDLDTLGIYLARQGILWEISLQDLAKQSGSTLQDLRQQAPWSVEGPDED